jgi:hypothetical protein
MPNFLLVYHGGAMPQSEDEGARMMKAWMDWLGGLGAAVVDEGNPVGKSKTVHPGGRVSDDGGSDPASGYSILKAQDIDAATAMAKDCPHLQAGGTIEIAQIIEM